MRTFNEDTRVKIPALIQFLRLDYNYVTPGETPIDLETKIFISIFKRSISKINNINYSDDDIKNILREIDLTIKNNDLGKEFYNWLIAPNERPKLIDFDNIDNNDFSIVPELSFEVSSGHPFRPDLNILINGIPLAFLEVKKPNNPGGIQSEFKRMINDRFANPEYKKYFNLIQFISFSNNMEYEDDNDAYEDPKAGSFYTTPNGFQTTFSFFRDEEVKTSGFIVVSDKKIRNILKSNNYDTSIADTPEFQTNLELTTPCNRFVTSFFEKERLLYLLKYGMVFVDKKAPEKHIMRYPQFFATRQILKRLKAGSKSGIIWHTQGSGKTALAAYANKVIKDYFSELDINTRFFFVVDRLDLLTQASTEMSIRGFNVVNVNSRDAFAKELNKALTVNTSMNSIGEFTVVNIHKFNDKMPVAKNDYRTKIQRVIFIDEAHRSYSSHGEYLKNLMLVDDDAIFIALTGTPLLSKQERSNLKFGDYIHKYFYDKSIADGYTLRIKKETLDTVAKAEIKHNIEIEDPDIDKDIIYESQAYINALGAYIEKDFKNFRFQNTDNTIGGMIVCSSNPQAKMVQKWFEDNSQLVSGLVITDESIPSQVNKETQLAFKDTLLPDILVVHQMLTTGYDVPRLKKMYLLRNAKQHTLLQTISRVNRPYKSNLGKVYNYGYIVDFVDIEREYENTINSYIKELEEDLIDADSGEGSINGIVIGKEEINIKYKELQAKVDAMIDSSNLEQVSRDIVGWNKEKLYELRRLLRKIKECYTEFLLSRAKELADQIDEVKLKKLIKEIENRISFMNLRTDTVNTLDIISNGEIVEIIYEFIRVKFGILDLSKFAANNDVQEIIKAVTEIQNEIKKNKHKGDIKVINWTSF